MGGHLVTENTAICKQHDTAYFTAYKLGAGLAYLATRHGVGLPVQIVDRTLSSSSSSSIHLNK